MLTLVLVFLSLFWVPGELHYVITETYSFEVEEAAPVFLAVFLPTSGVYQHVSEPDISWSGAWDIRSEGRLDVLFFELALEAEQIEKAVIQYQVNLFQGKAGWIGDPITSYDLASTEVIQSDHPEIVTKAHALAGSREPQGAARQIFNFTYRHLDWPKGNRTDPDLSALSAFQSGVGACTEHANLMTALCRAADIPAHTISGLAMPELIPFIPVSKTWNHPAGAHAWVEFHADGVWQMADPSWSDKFYKRDLFGWTDGKHLAYDTALHETQVYETLLATAEDQGGWIAAMSAPMHFVAWSDMEAESMTFTPTVSVRKTWDARLLMAVSVIIIMVVMNWLIEVDRKRN